MEAFDRVARPKIRSDLRAYDISVTPIVDRLTYSIITGFFESYQDEMLVGGCSSCPILHPCTATLTTAS